MDAAVVEQGPHDNGVEDIGEHALLAHLPQQQGETYHDQSYKQQREIDAASIK